LREAALGTIETHSLGYEEREESLMTRITMTLRKRARLLRNTVLLGTLGLLLLTGCHTTAGFGQDMQSVGRNIENSANKNNK
jgi:predicted small secreted protein